MATADASEVVRRFRIWRMRHRHDATTANLATEIGIPEKVVKKILMGASDAPTYMQRITAFIDAFEHGDLTVMEEIAQASELLPEPHTSKAYSLAVLRAIKTRQTAQVEDESRPYCLITKQEIAPRQCILAQNARDCVGCAASTKFCLECGFDRVAFPGSDLCAYCLTTALDDSRTDMKTTALPIKVSCPQSGGQKISVSICQRLQSHACGDCKAATRICLDCKERRVRYPQFGACLECYTKLMAPDWKPLSKATRELMRGQRDAFFARETEVKLPPVVHTKPKHDPPMQSTGSRVLHASSSPTIDELATISLTEALFRLWGRIREQHPEVPAAVISPTFHWREKRNSFARHATPMSCQPITIQDESRSQIRKIVTIADTPNQTAGEILADLLHEAAHGIALTRGIFDCSVNRYHNVHFKVIAWSLGLCVEQIPSYGFAKTTVSPETLEYYAPALTHLTSILEERRKVVAVQSSHRKAYTAGRYLKASCDCGYNLRISRAVMSATRIICETCGKPFQFAE